MRTITVTGQGAGTAVPDTAVLRVAAVHRAATLPEALAGAESARAAIVETARRHTDQIASRGLSVGPRPEGWEGGFGARHTLELRCVDLAAAAALVDALAGQVETRLEIEHVGLEVSDPRAARSVAREAAFADARAKGDQLAAMTGSTLGRVQSVVEGGEPGFPRARGLAAAGVSFEPGEATVSETLTVTWELL